jgi:hypothetical protein
MHKSELRFEGTFQLFLVFPKEIMLILGKIVWFNYLMYVSFFTEKLHWALGAKTKSALKQSDLEGFIWNQKWEHVMNVLQRKTILP